MVHRDVPDERNQTVKIGIILGSIRTERKTEAVARYVHGLAGKRSGDTAFELVDLAEFDVPPLTTSVHPMAANKSYDDAGVQRWSDAIDACDAYLFVTPEYNHGVPGGFKNAVDSLGLEWVGKPVAFIGHGSVGGVRAIEQWRQIVANFSMPVVRSEVNFNGFTHWQDGEFQPEDRHVDEVNGVFDDLEHLTRTVRD